ncbi:hypothetical protein [Synechococcus sp. MU1655]|uniref:hypothetical protein n=1 Tax=Synechococcus sp. MU1655 TaxID=2508355 RepID=UPI0020262AEF|nr:hypothetical protein [Synechococcus sp. MU1655]
MKRHAEGLITTWNLQRLWSFERLSTQHFRGRSSCGGNPDGECQPLGGVCAGLGDTE